MSLSGETPELKNEAIELALAYSIVTRYTSFLAIPESEVTSAVRGTLQQERARRQNILKKHSDAASLSRDLMPPGDPVLSVRAAASSQGVAAIFPFGLTLDLKYSAQSELWEGRFLVPKDVRDGTYQILVFITDAFGVASQTTATYEIDSQAPAITIGTTIEETTAEGTHVRLSVSADEAIREVRTSGVGFTTQRISAHSLTRCTLQGCLLSKTGKNESSGLLLLKPGVHVLRVVVTDEARNETVREVTISVPGLEEAL
jgi:Ca-activated chloride channel family protein